jgi:hypothetical protein
MNTSFECDSNTYFNFAKGFGNGNINLLRGPGYPIFLIFTGTTWANTFLLILFLQWLMGLISIILILKVLNLKNNAVKFLVSLIFSLTGFTFFGARLFLAEQLTMFFVTIGIVSFLLYRRSRKFWILLLSISSCLGAFLTRWEVLPVLVIVVAAAVIELIPNLEYKKILICIGFPILVISSWSFLRSELSNGASQFGVIANESGSQLMISLNFVLLDEIKQHEGNNVELFPEKYNFFDSRNGPATEKLIQITKNHLREDSFWFDVKYKGLLGDASYAEEIRNIWEPARETPWVVVDWFFSGEHKKRSSQVIFLLNEVLVEKLGSKEADSLMRMASFEIIRNNPTVLLKYAEKSFKWYGYDSTLNYGFSIGAKSLSYWDVPLNPASCASAVLTNNQFAKYVSTFSQVKALAFSQSLTAYAMDSFRILYTFLIFIWVLLFSIRKVKFDFNVVFTFIMHFSVIQFLVLSQVGIHSKYSIIPGVLSLISVVCILNSFLQLRDRSSISRE